MKHLYTLFFLLLFINSSAQLVADYYLAYNDKRPMIVSKYLSMMPPGLEDKETHYISDNVSRLCANQINGHVIISWSVCDDSTNSVFIISKNTGHNDSLVVEVVYNIPVTLGKPLLYSAIDKEKIRDSTFYELFKITDKGVIKKIATVFIPIMAPPNSKSKNFFSKD